MRAIADERLIDIEDLAMDSVKQIRAYFKYEGNDSRYMQKAKQAASVISAYARLRATETNRMALELHAERAQAQLMEAGQMSSSKRKALSA